MWKRVKDPRKDRGKRHPLVGLLVLLVLGFLTRAGALRDVEQLGKDLPNRRIFGLRGAPSDTTLDRVVRALSPVELRGVLEAQVHQMVRSKQLPNDPGIGLSLVAIDGKRFGTSAEPVHGASRRCPTNPLAEAERYQVHALRAAHVSSAVKPVLGQQVVASGEGEVNTLIPFVEHLLATYGSVVECLVLDAGFASYLNFDRLNRLGVGFIVAVKDNTRRLARWAHAALGEQEAAPAHGWEVERTEGPPSRRVNRAFARVAADPEAMEEITWQGQLTEVWRVRTVGVRDGKPYIGNRYFVTNLETSRLRGDQALAAVRAHWGIENDCNGTMDLQLNEDTQTWVNQGQASEVLAMLRLIAYNFLRLLRQRVLRAKGTPLTAWRTLMGWIHQTVLLPSHVWEPSGVA